MSHTHVTQRESRHDKVLKKLGVAGTWNLQCIFDDMVTCCGSYLGVEPSLAPLASSGMKACKAHAYITATLGCMHDTALSCRPVKGSYAPRLLALDTRMGPKVFTSKTLCRLLLSSLDKAVSAE